MSYEVLKRAIESRRSLTGIYDDYLRVFTPHILGKSTTGEPSVLCFQYGGGHPDGPLPHGGAWYLFAVNRLRRLEPNGDVWIAGPRDSKPLHLIAKIDVDGSVDDSMSA